jgi:large subunit ribosomal protein L22
MARIMAKHRFARIAATKVRPFADLIRGQGAGEGLLLLKYEPNRGARMIEKVLKSAIANCEDRGARNVAGWPT